MAYNPLVPTGTVKLNVDYQNVQGNFQQADTSFGIDHLPFSNNTAQNGYHTKIHLVPTSTIVTNPPENYPITPVTPTPGYGQLFSAQIDDKLAIDEALFFITGGGRTLQLTSNVDPSAVQDGYTFLAGGLLIQWGKVVSTANNGIQNFNKSFPNTTFIVLLTSTINAASNHANGLYVVGTPSNTSFVWNQGDRASGQTGFYWIAIGN